MTPGSRPELTLWQRFLGTLPGMFLWLLISLGFQAAGLSLLTSHLLAMVVAFTGLLAARAALRRRAGVNSSSS